MNDTLILILAIISILSLINLSVMIRVTHKATVLSEMFIHRPDIPLGTPAPDFEAQTTEGKTVSLASFRDQSVVLIFISPYCGMCKEEIITLEKQQMLGGFKGLNVVFVSDAVQIETLDMVADFKRRMNLIITLPILMAPKMENHFVREYNRKGNYPFFCFINEKGIVESQGIVHNQDWINLARRWK